MHILYIHPDFPSQFRYLAPRLASECGWNYSFTTQNEKADAPPDVQKVIYQPGPTCTRSPHPTIRRFEGTVGHALGVYDAMRTRPDIQPDLVVAHGSFGASLFLPYLYDAPIINFFEYFYRPLGQDMGYRPEQPVTEDDLLRCRTANAMTLLDLDNCDRAWCPSLYQRDLMPKDYHAKIEVVHDGIDTDLFQRRTDAPRRLPDGEEIPSGTRVVTYVSRGFEMLRGFDVFMRLAQRIQAEYPDVIFVVMGSDRVCYGSAHQSGEYASFRERVLQLGGYDLSRFRFTGFVPPEAVARMLSISDLHIYLTVPFVISWSPLEAMACSCVMLASDQPCVRDFVRDGENGLLCDFFDEEAMAARALQVLRDPAAFKPLGEAARRTIEERCSIDVTLPRIKRMFEEVAGRKRQPSLRAEGLLRQGRRAAVAPKAKDDEAGRIEKESRLLPPFDGTIPFYADIACARAAALDNGSARTKGVTTPSESRTVLFAWELGGGLGHLMQMLPLAEDLVRSGHRVFVAARELDRAASILGRSGVRFLQAPLSPSASRSFPHPITFAHMLANVGFGSDVALFSLACAWRNLMKMVRPDLIVFDHAPTALLASRGLPARRALIGSGFCCPADNAPGGENQPRLWGMLRPAAAAKADVGQLQADVDKITARVNRVLASWNQPPIQRLGQLYSEVDENFLTTFPELDHFPDRRGAAYWGPIAGSGGIAPHWPDGQGRRIFAYLKPSPATQHVLEALKRSGNPTLVYLDHADAAERQRLQGPTLRIETRPIDIARVGRECDLAVLHGGHGVTAEMLLAGKPILQIPLALEQRLMAEAVSRLGAGKAMIARKLEPISDALEGLLSGRYDAGARRFAERYAAFDRWRQRERMLARALDLVGPLQSEARRPATVRFAS